MTWVSITSAIGARVFPNFITFLFFNTIIFYNWIFIFYFFFIYYTFTCTCIINPWVWTVWILIKIIYSIENIGTQECSDGFTFICTVDSKAWLLRLEYFGSRNLGRSIHITYSVVLCLHIYSVTEYCTLKIWRGKKNPHFYNAFYTHHYVEKKNIATCDAKRKNYYLIIWK